MFLTCAGLKSLLYSRVPRSDPRIAAALDYLGRNYTVKENPGCGQAGVYTYLFTLTQALRALKSDQLPATDRFWRQDVVLELLRRQQGTGSWQQGRADWWENHPELVTAYGLLMLELAAAPELH
jgi:squalene-hopene/tetraprenyl-beta-curcumene cyclase